MYDIFYVSSDSIEETSWKSFKNRYPLAQKLEFVKSYEEIKSKAFTNMFWIVWNDVILSEEFDLNSYKATQWDDMYVHVFKNSSYYDGICLCPKKCSITEKEYQHRFFINKKEIDIVASYHRPFEKFVVDTYEDYLKACEKSRTDMFWAVWNDIVVNKDFNFDYQVIKHNQNVVHIFKNGEFYDGICLFSKYQKVSKREFEHRFFSDKKEIDIIASTPKKYDRIHASNYDDYIKQLKKISSEFVWVIPDDVETDFNFDYQIPYWEKDVIHIFKNGKFNDGVFLQHKDRYISQREYEYCWHTKKKEIPILASMPESYDIVFISYNEPNADENYERLLKQFPDRTIHRIHGVKGIHQAHIEAAKLCNTVMFWVVDGDAQILDTFKFDHQVPKWHKDNVFVWRSQNPINDLEYGYGGVKLFPVKETIEMDTTKTDMTTSISTKFNAMHEVSNVTAFNTDPFNTWKSAFRECVKLSSKTIQGQVDEETNQRLNVWLTVGADKKYGSFAIAGANDGRNFGLDDDSDLRLINDFDWLKARFDGSF